MVRNLDAGVPPSCRGTLRTELRLGASVPVSARLSARVKSWFLAATSVQMENLRSFGLVCVVVFCGGVVVCSVATFKSVMVIPAVCPRLFEILTSLTFRALGRSHTVSTACETIAKKTQRQASPVVHLFV